MKTAKEITASLRKAGMSEEEIAETLRCRKAVGCVASDVHATGCPECQAWTPHAPLSNGKVICGICGTEH